MKAAKTAEVSAKVLQDAEKQAAAAVAKVRQKRPVLTEVRKALWFEKFHWFISSENYLVIAGKDAQQNEMLVKRWDLGRGFGGHVC